MKENILKQMFYGNIEPMEITSELSEDIMSRVHKANENEKKFIENLTDDKLEEYEKIMSEWINYHIADCAHYYVVGFRIGALMMKDILEEDE